VTATNGFRARALRLILAFLALMSSVVLITGAQKADAASDDLMIQASVDSSTIADGAVSNWTLTVETSADLTLATGIVVTNTLPDGLCPYGAGDADCAAGTAPSPAYTTATENPDGSWMLVWDLADMGPSSVVEITYSTVARSHYQEGFADDTPVLAGDAWINSAQVTGDVDGVGATDVSTAGQTAGGVSLTAEIATRPAVLSQPEVCGDGSAFTWNDATATGYRIGDQVCWRVSIDYPAGLVTADSEVSVTVPAGQDYTASDTWSGGAGNTVPGGDIDGSAVTPGAGSLTWHVGDGSGYVAAAERLEVVLSTTIVDPTATWSGQSVISLTGHVHHTTSGGSINTSDSAIAQILEAELDLTKGVTAVNAIPTGGSVDGATVKEADVVTYELAVTNSGDVDAADVVVWDLLPTLLAPCTSQIGPISNGGTCVDVDNRIEWSGPAVLAVAAGATTTVTYEATIPSGIAPEITLANRAGVVTYASATNNGTFTYIPSSNIDTEAGTPNTASADDTSSVVTPTLTITSSRTTGVDEAGNNAGSQAAIGELITYTITMVIPEGTTVWDGLFVDDLPANLDLVSSSHTFDGEEPVVLTEDGAVDSVMVEFPDPSYRNATGTGADTLEVTIAARVIDIPANSRGTSIGSSAEFTWLDQGAAPHSHGTSVSTTVVEPSLTITKSSVDSIGDNGTVVGNEVVDYTVTVTNPAVGNVSTAHDLVIVDTLPEGVTLALPVADGGVWVEDSTAGDGVGGTITWTASPLAPGSALTRSYQVTVDDPVVVNTTFVNNVDVDGSSMAGTPAIERSAGTGYHAEAGHVLSTPVATLGRDVSPTSVTIGEVIAMTLEVTMPPGTIMYDATVIDSLPPGMEFDGIVSSSCDMEGSPCDPMINVTELGALGTTTAAFFLGDIDVSSTTGQDRVVTIEYRAHLADSGVAGDTRVSSASAYGNQTDQIAGTPGSVPLPSSFDVAVGPVTDTVRIVEPLMSIDKDVSGQTGDGDSRRAVPGDVLTYTIVAANSAAVYISPAHDLVVVDTVPEELNVTLPIPDGGVWSPDGTAGNGVAGTITWTELGPVTPGGTISLAYEATVEPSLDSGDESSGGSEAVNTVDVTSYFGVPAADRAANPTFTYRDYDNVTADEVQIELDLASIGGSVWFDVDADGVREAGEPPFEDVDLTVTYLGLDGVVSGDDETHVATTAGDGSAIVEHLPGGSYTVVVDPADIPAGFVPSYDLDGGTLDPDGSWGPGPLGENEDKLDVDFGYTGNGSIGGTVWFDNDVDQLIGGAEYGLAGVGLTITWLGVDGIPGGDDVAYPVITDADGDYQVSMLPSGIYTIVVDAGTIPTGMDPTYDTNGVGTPGETMVMLPGGADDVSEHFGYAGTGTIGDFVWLDRNGDGAQDGSEPGIMGVPVELTWPGENGMLGGGDDDVFLTTTDGSGAYAFPNMPPGEYRITILGGLPAAAPSTFDEDGGSDAVTVVNLGDGEIHLGADFGFHGTASIGDIVWWDIDADGGLDAGEPGVAGVTIDLTYAGLDGVFGNGDDLSFSTTTGAGGGYLFPDLPAGNYVVTVDAGVPGGMVQTYDEDGGGDGSSLVTGLTVDELYLASDFGYAGTGSIGDYVWLDLDSNGVQDVAEPGLPDVEIEVVWAGVDGVIPSGDDVRLTTTTDIDGNYMFTDLPAGEYGVVVDPLSLPPDAIPTYDADGLLTPHVSIVVLPGGGNETGQDFGYNGGAAVGGLIWFDQDGDGLAAASEYGVEGVSIDVIWAGPDGIHTTADDETFTKTTGADGSYIVSNLPVGQYAVVVDAGSLPAGMFAAYDEDGVLDHRTLFAIAEGEAHLSADFGYNGTGSIGDLVWFDSDGDGVPAVEEPGVPGQEVTLTAAGNDGVIGTGDDQSYGTYTTTSGGYIFANLPPGVYGVEVAGEIATSAANTDDEDGDLDSYVEITLGGGESHDGADFGYLGSGRVGDLIWLDVDADGAAGDDEPGMPGIEIGVTWLGGDGVAGGGDDLLVGRLTTDGDGVYLVDGLPVGNHEVVVGDGIADGLGNSFDADGDGDGRFITSVAWGEEQLDIDFGYAGSGVIGDTLWWDLDNDGERSELEPGVSLEVGLTWAGLDDVPATGDEVLWIATADTDGLYSFADLPPGTFEVVVDTGGLPPGVEPSTDPDTLADGSSVLTLGPNESATDQDFGFRGEGAISGSVWVDVDSSGARGGEEPGLAGVELTVSYLGPDEPVGEDATFVALTDGSGGYMVPGLPSGFFEVKAAESSLPDGHRFAEDEGNPPVVSLTVGLAATVTDVGFRTLGTGALGGLVWNDRDGDEQPGVAEVGVAGVGVDVTWQHPGGEVTLTAESDPFGLWHLADLPPGLYQTAIDGLSLPLGMSGTTATDLPVVLDPAASEDADFGIALMLDVGSRVWVDQNGNGLVEVDENGVARVLVNLYDELGGLVAFTETDALGAYSFQGLYPGGYSLQLDRQSIPNGLRPSWDRDGIPDLATSLDLTGGVHALDANFGFQTELPLTGFDVDVLAIWGALLTLFGIGLVLAAHVKTQRVTGEVSLDVAR